MNNEKILKGNLVKVFISYLIPTVISMLTFGLYVLADTMFVGIGTGTKELAAFNIAVPAFTIYSAIGLMFGVGGATTMSIFSGAGDTSKNTLIFSLTIYLCATIGILISVVGTVYIDIFSKLLGADESILQLTSTYLRPVNALAFANIMSNCLQVFIRNDANPRIVMIATIISNISNIIGDYVLIFIFKMGILGASIPTAVAPLLALLIMTIHFRKSKGTLKLNLKIQSPQLILKIIKNGLGSFFMEITNGLSIFIFNFILINKVGSKGVSAYAIIANIGYVFKYIFMAIAQSAQPIISLNYGAKNKKRVKEILKISIIFSIITGVILYIIIFLFSKQIVSAFTNNDVSILDIADTGLKIFFLSLPFTAINTVLVYYYQSIERTKLSSFISFLRNFFFIILGITLLTPMFGLEGIWSTIIFAEMTTILIVIFVYYFKNKK